MPSTVLFLTATLLLSLNFVRPFGLALSDWLYFCALFLGVAETFLIQRRHAACWWHNRFLWAVALIVFGALISTINSRHWSTALLEIFQQAFVMTLFVSLAWIMVRRGKIPPIVFAFILTGVFTAGIATYDYFTGSRIGPFLSGTPDLQLWGRYAGTLGHPNKLGYFLVLTALLSVGQLLRLKSTRAVWFSYLLWGVLLAVQLFGIYISGSMSAYLGFLLGILVIILSSTRILYSVTKIFAVVMAAGLLLAIFNVVFNTTSLRNMPGSRNSQITQALNRIQTVTGESRLKNYSQAWDRITLNPWVGVGYDQISTSGVSSSSRLLDDAVHNPLLQIWYTGGIFAFIGWLAIYGLVGWTALGAIKKASQSGLPLVLSLAAATLAALLMDQFQDAIYQREKWLVIGLLISFAWEQSEVETESPVRHESQPMDLLPSGQELSASETNP
ncbi:MAG: hypothetical protein EHM40_03570 [Chloroflexi bacterium]|nr:MAG: hypothetical protein EHM40_03570 [Chloroflexota bacterium]